MSLIGTPRVFGSTGRATTSSPSAEFAPQLTTLPNGQILVTYLRDGQAGLLAQVVRADGSVVSAEKVISYTAGYESTDMASVSVAPDGTIWIADAAFNIAKQNYESQVTRFSLADLLDGGAQPVWYTPDKPAAGRQVFPDIKIAANGNAIVTWIELPSNATVEDVQLQITGNIRATIYSAAANPTATLNTTTGLFSVNNLTYGAGAFGVETVVLTDNSFIVFWEGGIGGGAGGVDIVAQRFSATGSKIGSPAVINKLTAGIQFNADAALLDNGDIVVVWQDGSNSGNLNDIVGRIMHPDLVARGDPFFVQEDRAGVQRDPKVIAAPGDGFFVAWTDESGLGTDPGVGVRARRFGDDGISQGSIFQLNTKMVGDQTNAQLAVSGNLLLTAWEDFFEQGTSTTGEDIFWQAYDATQTIFSTKIPNAPEYTYYGAWHGYYNVQVTPEGQFFTASLQYGSQGVSPAYVIDVFAADNPARRIAQNIFDADISNSFQFGTTLVLGENGYALVRGNGSYSSFRQSNETNIANLTSDDFGEWQDGSPEGPLVDLSFAESERVTHSNPAYPILIAGTNGYSFVLDSQYIDVNGYGAGQRVMLKEYDSDNVEVGRFFIGSTPSNSKSDFYVTKLGPSYLIEYEGFQTIILVDRPVATLPGLRGTAGPDRMIGAAGRDHLIGLAGDDRLLGEAPDAPYDAAAAQVYRLYEATLGRAPDMAGHASWTNRLLSGTSLETVSSGFIGSREFALRYDADTSREFITLLYANVLDRAPDAAGMAGWLRAVDVNGMSRATLVTRFSESRENIANTEAGAFAFSRIGHQADWGDEVFRLYLATLGRHPDAAGFGGWTNALAHGTTFDAVAQSFVASAEFAQRFHADTSAQFVTLLYANVLGRAPDAGGLAGWVRALDVGGQSRGRVAIGFSESAENIASTKATYERFMARIAEGDRLEGGQGTNILWGGLGSDTFVFDKADLGTHYVAGLEAWDELVFTGFGYASTAQVRAHMVQSGADVAFRDAGTTVIFEDIRLSAISNDQFVL